MGGASVPSIVLSHSMNACLDLDLGSFEAGPSLGLFVMFLEPLLNVFGRCGVAHDRAGRRGGVGTLAVVLP